MSLAAGIIAERPTFRLFENNCQNFVRFLLEVLCPGVSIPDTIQEVARYIDYGGGLQGCPAGRLPRVSGLKYEYVIFFGREQ